MEQERQPTEEQPAQPDEGPLETTSLLRWCISLLTANAWQRMGLIPDPATNKIERNLEDARLAIDAVAALVEQVKPRLADTERREVEKLLTDLRLNFVQQQARP